MISPYPDLGVPNGSVGAEGSGKVAARIRRSRETVRIDLPPGAYTVRFDRVLLSVLREIEIESGQETRRDLAAELGKLRLVPMDKEKFSRLEVLNEKGTRVRALYPSEQSAFYGLAPGKYRVRFEYQHLSPVSFEVKIGQETTVKLMESLGKIRLVPMEKEKFSWLEVLNEKGTRVRGLYPSEQRAFYGLTPGKYRVRFEYQHLSPVSFEVAADQETSVKLLESLGKVRLVPMEKEKFSWLEFLTDKGTRVRGLYASQQRDFYGLAPGKYQVRFEYQHLSPVSFEVKVGQETTVELSESLGKVRLVPMEKESFSWLEFVNEKGTRVRGLYPSFQKDFYGLAPGKYQVRFEHRHLSPVSFEVQAGQETSVELSESLGRVRLVPMEKASFGWLEFLNDKGTRVRSMYPSDQRDFYGLAPGRYQVRFEKTYLMPAPFVVAIGAETALEFGSLLGRLEIDPIGGSPAANFELFDGEIDARLASVGPSHGPFYGVPPGRYRLRFRSRDLPEVKLVIEGGRTTRVVPGETEAFPQDHEELSRLPVAITAGDTTATLSWKAPEGLDVAGYRIYTTGSSRSIHGTAVIPEPAYRVIGLTNGRTYTFLVRTVSRDGIERSVHKPTSVTPAAAPEVR